MIQTYGAIQRGFLVADKKKSLHIIKISSNELELGMYVSSLDRDWLETPFLLQGFILENDAQITTLTKYCAHVFIDVYKSGKYKQKTNASAATSVSHELNSKLGKFQASVKPIKTNLARYPKTRSASGTDIERAASSLRDVKSQIKAINLDFTEEKGLNQEAVENASHSLVQTAVRYPLALSWLALVQKKDNALFDRSLRISTWALMCGRHIGLSQSELQWITAAVLMLNVGYVAKVKGKTGAEEKLSRYRATRRSVAVMKKRGVHAKVIEVMDHCYEKFNGSGQPERLLGEETPLTSRIVGLAIAYDELLHPADPRRYSSTPMQASKSIYRERGRSFQSELAELFIESIGIYPSGTILELNTGELAVAIEQPVQNKLTPRVILVSDSQRLKLAQYQLIDLGKESMSNDGVRRQVARDLPPHGLGIDLAAVDEAYQALAYPSTQSSELKPTLFTTIKNWLSGAKSKDAHNHAA